MLTQGTASVEFSDAITRTELLDRLVQTNTFDIIIIGGGIHGAAFARIAASSGAKTLLVEKADFASGTSSRSSKMAHGGLRYLEMLDFKQVFEGIRARESLFSELPNLVRPEPFLIPIPKKAWFQRLKLGIGLHIYDLLVQNPSRKHSWLSKAELVDRGYKVGAEPLAGCYQYFDGLMDDARLVIENLIAARRAGAITLNYSSVERVEQSSNSITHVHLVDELTGSTREVRARLVVNCAGPWAVSLQNSSPRDGFASGSESNLPQLKAVYSRGSHLIFNTPWTGPSLFLPMEGKARYYFVWPHFAGTMVGTTERETSTLEFDPIPSQDEVEEILARLSKDLPDSNLNRGTLIYCFAGVRTLPLRSAKKNSAQLSRKHIWALNGRILSLLGGKYTTAQWTAKEGFEIAAKCLGLPMPEVLEPLPASASCDELESLKSKLIDYDKTSKTVAERLIYRYGKRAQELVGRSDLLRELTPNCTLAEIKIAVTVEQSVTVEDIMRRRLLLEYFADHGFAALPAVVSELKSAFYGVDRRELESASSQLIDFHSQVDLFRERMRKIDELCGMRSANYPQVPNPAVSALFSAYTSLRKLSHSCDLQQVMSRNGSTFAPRLRQK